MTLRKSRWDSAFTLNDNPTQQAAPATQDTSVEEPVQAAAVESPPQAAPTAVESPAESAADGAGTPAQAAPDGAETPAQAPDGGADPATSAEVDIGNVVEGTVQRITPYGAFVQLAGGKVGLIHISEIDRNYVKDVHEFLRESDVVKAKVLTIKEDGKIDLSIKAMQDPQPRLQRKRGSDPEFEQKLKRFMRQSEERQVDYKRSVEHKRK
ncbi:MAG: S1 RNA-binding domain-containing protein [Actinomycetota bacterium]